MLLSINFFLTLGTTTTAVRETSAGGSGSDDMRIGWNMELNSPQAGASQEQLTVNFFDVIDCMLRIGRIMEYS